MLETGHNATGARGHPETTDIAIEAVDNGLACSMLSTVFQHDRIVSSIQKKFTAQDVVECSNVSLSAENNSGVL